MKKLFLLIVVLFIAGGIGYTVYNRGEDDYQGHHEYDTFIVKRGNIAKTISTDGIVEPNFAVEVKSKASGEIINIFFDEGEYVKKGDLLVKLDPSDEERNVRRMKLEVESSRARLRRVKSELSILEKTLPIEIAEARSNLMAREAEVAELESKLKRAGELSRKNLISTEEIEKTDTDYKKALADYEAIKSMLSRTKVKKYELELKRHDIALAETEVEKSEISLEEAEERLADTKIRSSIDGIILSQFVEKGQIISSGISNVSGGTLLLSVADLSRLFIIASVDEADIGEVKIGQQADIMADTYMDRTFSGKVVHIAPQGAVESNITTFRVKVEVKEGEEKSLLKPGMTVNVNIIAAEREDIFFVPFSTVDKQNGKYIVYRIKNNDISIQPVTVGITDGINLEIIEGLKEGDEIVKNITLLKKLEFNRAKKDSRARDMRRFMWRMRSK